MIMIKIVSADNIISWFIFSLLPGLMPDLPSEDWNCVVTVDC
jgi:hypothetical protein